MAEALTPQLKISNNEIKQAIRWVNFFAAEWEGEIPLKIHRNEVDDGHGLGGPAFHPEFLRWIGNTCRCPSCIREERERRNRDSRIAVTRAFRKLRKEAPREFDVLYAICVHKNSMDTTVNFLNARAERRGWPERYDKTGVLVLLLSGVHKVRSYLGYTKVII